MPSPGNAEGAPPPPDDEALARVHEGWDHFRLQRPLAAWASWQRALRIDPEHAAARQALDFLAGAADLPAEARAVHRFRAPRDPVRRGRWNERLGGRNLEDLAEAARTFAELAAEDPLDAPARYNHALCMAWLGRNAEAIEELDRVVELLAEEEPAEAAGAWALAEILRQGAGAEGLADDLRYALIGPPLDDEDLGRLAGLPHVIGLPTPRDPASQVGFEGTQIFEWLDRPLPPAGTSGPSASEFPRLLATAVASPGSFRLSSPDPSALVRAEEEMAGLLGDGAPVFRREASPLPLGLLDAAVWTFRLPPGLDAEAERLATRDAVESYFEGEWIHAPRRGLGDRTPLEVGRAAEAGDAVARAKLAGVVRVREQLGARAPTARLYQGYPFDRLRRRLGLPLANSSSVDPDDLACMGATELAKLDPASLDEVRLAEAIRSAAGLRDEALSARFAAGRSRRNGTNPPPIEKTSP